MRRRPFGATGLEVSERGFGAWAIGGQSFGAVSASDALAALARAEDLGCNFVDTAAVYGRSEELLGTFLRGRRDRWIVASKYSGQDCGMTSLVDQQLLRLGIDCIDFYQLHWAPHGDDRCLYDELDVLKRSGKIRHCGVSLRSAKDIDAALDQPIVEGLQICVSLLDPAPLVQRLDRIRARRVAVIARSALKGGFLTGKFDASTRFQDPADQRREWSSERILETARNAAAFDFLRGPAGSLHAAALAYPLSFDEVSTVVVSSKDVQQVELNFDEGLLSRLDPATLERIEQTQRHLGVYPVGSALRAWRRLRARFTGR
jgi:myo-inositol catabolism protein IolS